MGTSICHSVISQMINFFVACCFVNPGSDPSSDPGSDPSSDPGSDPSSDPSSDPGFILSLSLEKVSARITNIIRITQITFEFVNNALMIY